MFRASIPVTSDFPDLPGPANNAVRPGPDEQDWRSPAGRPGGGRRP